MSIGIERSAGPTAIRPFHLDVPFVCVNELRKGGRFATWEEPELFASEIRAAFRALRQPNIP
jgi:hypothetical protein